MTKRDYEKFARMFGKQLAGEQEGYALMVINELIEATCDIFAKDNPLFDKDRFIEKVKLHTILETK